MQEAKLPGLEEPVFDIVMTEGFGIPTFVSSIISYYFQVRDLKDLGTTNHPCRADALMKKYFGSVFELVYQKEVEKAVEQHKKMEELAAQGDAKAKETVKEWPRDENGHPYKLYNRKTKEGKCVFVPLFNEEKIIQANLSSITSFLTAKIDKNSSDPDTQNILVQLPEINDAIQHANERLKQLKTTYEN